MAIIDEILRLESAASIIKAKTAELGLEKSSGVPVSISDNLTAQASAINTISKKTSVSQTLTYTSNTVSLPAGYYGSESNVTVSTLATPSVTLSGVSQTISCANKVMSDDITIPAANVYTTGSSVPSNSSGNDGDLFLIV